MTSASVWYIYVVGQRAAPRVPRDIDRNKSTVISNLSVILVRARARGGRKFCAPLPRAAPFSFLLPAFNAIGREREMKYLPRELVYAAYSVET